MIYAKCIENEGPVSKRKYPLEIGKMYEVDLIDMGSSSTDILLKGFNDRDSKSWFNSVCFEFYEDDKEIDIYSDKRFNPYL
jgi:hypothetical protein